MNTEKDYFENDIFKSDVWSAPHLISPAQIRMQLESFKLEGRRIKDFDLIGLCYSMTRDSLEGSVWSELKKNKEYTEAEKEYKSQYEHFDDETPIPVFAEIDEPMSIIFEDGDVFVFLVEYTREYRLSMNRISLYVESAINRVNVLIDKVFQNCIGRTISTVEVQTRIVEEEELPFRSPYKTDENDNEIVDNIILRFDDGNGLMFYGWYDYCHVAYVDAKNQIINSTFKEIEPALFNWGDYHIDATNGFTASSPDVFLGVKGADEASVPYLTITPSSRVSALYISNYDFDLFAICIAHFTHKWFDQYSAYSFSQDEWKAIMTYAANALNCKTYHEMHEFIRNEKICEDVFKNRDKYQKQFNDVKKWTELVVSQDDEILVLGF